VPELRQAMKHGGDPLEDKIIKEFLDSMKFLNPN
jgi:hypothetical protein